jgi:hypothetical protein
MPHSLYVSRAHSSFSHILICTTLVFQHIARYAVARMITVLQVHTFAVWQISHVTS